MKVAVIGSGGREHALVKKISASKKVREVFAIPGNIGMDNLATRVDINIDDFESIHRLCVDEGIEWVIVGPEDPLANGIADFLTEKGIKVFGPDKKSAQMESSKDFTKQLMKKYDIPTAKFETFNQIDEAKEYVSNAAMPIVLKYDGLAAGKGVIIAHTLEEAESGLDALMGTDDSSPVVIEEFLDGEEFSLMILVNGDFYHPFEMIAQDHKRAFDGDTGPNTGGMGAYAPVSHITDTVRKKAVDDIVGPIVEAMVGEGLDYFGVLYLGAIVNDAGEVKVIEFNARFGDPEAQVLLEMLDSDLMEVIVSLYEKREFELQWKDGYTVGVMLASDGYPGSYDKGKPVDYDAVRDDVYVSGLTESDGRIVTSGGRVLLVLGYGETMDVALERAYENVNAVEYETGDLFYRKDIGHRAK